MESLLKIEGRNDLDDAIMKYRIYLDNDSHVEGSHGVQYDERL